MSIVPIRDHPDRAEMARRIRAVQAEMAKQGLDFYLCYDPANVFYLTNFANVVHERPFIVLVPADGTLTFLMPRLERQHVRSRSVGDIDVVPYIEFPAPQGQMWFDRLRDVLKPAHRVGLESMCPLAIAQAVPGPTIVCDIVDELRMIKSAYEIGRLAYTCELLNDGHRQLLAACRPGANVLALHGTCGGAMMGRLLAGNPRANIIASSFNAAVWPPDIAHDPHFIPDVTSTIVEGGPHVTIVSGRADGYGAEVERTFFVNRVPEAARRPFDVMMQARALAYELTVPGANMSEVDRQVNGLLKAQGYGDNLLHRTGHSFGVTSHEAPFIAEGYEREIKPGMVFSIEPGIYLPGIGGFRHSDTVLVTETGALNLTPAPDTLAELTLAR